MKLIILDRDGVINHDSDEYIKSPEEWHPVDGSLDAISRLNRAGYKVIVATNQSGVGRGYFDIETLNKIHQKMHSALKEFGGRIDAIFFCPHKPDDNCDCRKPKPGLFNSISNRLSVDLNNIPVVGDSTRDLEAAKAVLASPVLVKTGKGIATFNHTGFDHSIPVFENLYEYVESLLE